VLDVTEQTFELEVLEASFERPVVIDFWAAWCGPCKQLSPVLEDLAREAGGQWRLAKIDVDQAPRLAQYFQAQSIPMVLAIFQGQLLSQFTGALPKREVERWLGEVFKRAGLELKKLVEPEAPSDPDQAIAFYRKRLQQRPDDSKSKLALGRLLFAKGDVEGAEKLLKEIPFAAPEHGAAQAALALKELIAEIGAAGGEAAVRARAQAQPDDLEATYLTALADGTSGRFATALAVLVGHIGLPASRITPELKGRARKAAAMLLEAAGRGDPDVEAERKRLTRLLF
jgi:putative thioredoxin